MPLRARLIQEPANRLDRHAASWRKNFPITARLSQSGGTDLNGTMTLMPSKPEQVPPVPERRRIKADLLQGET